MSGIYGTTPTQSEGDSDIGEALLAQDQFEAPPETVSRTVTRSTLKQPYKPYHWVLMAYLFFFCSRIPELIPGAHFALLLTPILLIGLFTTGRVMDITRSRTGRILIGLVVWIGICVPFSAWFGGSVRTFIPEVLALLIVAFMAAFIRTVPDALRTAQVIGLAMAAAGTLSLLVGIGRGDRLTLGGSGSILGDPNTLCLYVLVGLPFLALTVELSTGFKRYAALALMVLIMGAAARTGSRAGVIAGLIGLCYYFFHASVKRRVAVVLATIALVILAAFFLPQRIRNRYFTYFQPQQKYTELYEASNSAEARKYLLKRSLVMTIKNPIFGVGPGQFEIVEAAMAKAEGVPPAWHVSHNSYTEISSEVGIPGAILFLAMIVSAYRSLTRMRRRSPDYRVRRMALYTQMALLMMMVGAFFQSVAYAGILYPLIALSIVLPLVARPAPRTAKASLS